MLQEEKTEGGTRTPAGAETKKRSSEGRSSVCVVFTLFHRTNQNIYIKKKKQKTWLCVDEQKNSDPDSEDRKKRRESKRRTDKKMKGKEGKTKHLRRKGKRITRTGR